MYTTQANISEVSVDIPHKYHNSIIGAKGRLIRAIMEDCGGVLIRFPPEGSTSDKVVIRGPKDDVEKARKQLTELTNERVSFSLTPNQLDLVVSTPVVMYNLQKKLSCSAM